MTLIQRFVKWACSMEDLIELLKNGDMLKNWSHYDHTD